MRRHCGVARRQVQRGRARTCSGGHSYADGGRSYFGSVAPGRCNLRIACLVLLGILGALASAAEPIRYYKFPDGRIRLWLKGAPTVTATDVAGWQIEPAGKDKDRTWLARLGKSAESSPWKALLESLESGTEPSGVYAIEPKATIELNADGSITVSTTGGLSKQVAGQKKPLSDYVALVLGVKAGAVVSALDNYAHAASETDFLDSFIAAARAANAPPLIIDSGNGPVVLAVHAAALPATTSSPNSPPTESTTSLQPSSAPLTTPIPWLPIGFAAGGLAIGFGAGWALKRPKEVTVRVPATPAKTAAVRPPNPVADEAWRKERDETLKVLEEERASSRRYKAESDAAAARLKQAQDDIKSKLSSEAANQLNPRREPSANDAAGTLRSPESRRRRWVSCRPRSADRKSPPRSDTCSTTPAPPCSSASRPPGPPSNARCSPISSASRAPSLLPLTRANWRSKPKRWPRPWARDPSKNRSTLTTVPASSTKSSASCATSETSTFRRSISTWTTPGPRMPFTFEPSMWSLAQEMVDL